MREWLVIENSWKNAVFAPDEAKAPRGYIPRDVVEPLLGRSIDGTVWCWPEPATRDSESGHSMNRGRAARRSRASQFPPLCPFCTATIVNGLVTITRHFGGVGGMG